MISDLARGRLPRTPPDAVVIVGSGAAGLAAAERLAAAGQDVVLLESGGDAHDTDPADHDLNVGRSIGLPYLGLVHGRARTLGGTTELWHGQCMRLHELDLAHRPWIAGSGWPLALGDLDEPYRRAEQWLGVTGRGYGPERWDEHPRLPRLDWDAEHLLHDFTEYTATPLVGRAHRAGLVADPRVQVVVNATVARVLLEHRARGGAASRVTGVEIATPDGTRVALAATQVVLAAGAIENARILQLSDPDGVGLGTGRRHTGRYLQDHPIVRTAELVPRDYRVLQDRYVALHRGRRRLFPKLRLSPQAQEHHGLVDATAVFVHDHDEPGLAAARRLLLAARANRRPEYPARDVAVALRSPLPVARDAFRRYARGLSTGTRPSAVWVQLWLEQVPDPASRIVLAPETDRLGLRRALVDWRADDRELETSRRMTRWIADDVRRLGLGTVRERTVMSDDDAWRAEVKDAAHPSGTTRMSSDPNAGVVNPDLQVHGVGGLSVVGGSVFPIAGYANPTLTIVALALRLADRLATASQPTS